MPFALNEEQILIDDALERLLASELAGVSAMQGVPVDIWPKLAELGLLGAALPESLGGTGGGPKELMLMARRLGRHLVSSPFLATVVVGSHLLQRAIASATPYAETALQAMAAGEYKLTLAAYEQPTRYGLSALRTTATPTTDGWKLNGSKHYVLDARTANGIVVAAGSGGAVGLYAVDPRSGGVQVLTYESVDGTSLATVHLDDVEVPTSRCLAGPDGGRAILDEALAMGAFAASADILGACEAALEQTVEYLKVREQFGTALSTFQALQHRASDLHAEIEMLRSLVMGAGQTLTEGMTRQSMADALAAIVMAAEVGDHVGREAIQMHGAIGMTRDLGLGRYLMRANTLTRLFGDADDCRLRYLSLIEESAA